MEAEKMPLDVAEIVKLKQLPIIEQQLQGVKEQFEAAVEEAQSLECTSETYKHVKARRAELTKVFNALEARRKTIKTAILAPYEAFEKIYKDCITSVYKPCDELLAGRIAEVEDELKAQKISDSRAYFDEYAKSRGIYFLEFDQAGITIGLSKSAKSIRADIKAFLDKVAEDLIYITTLERQSEILVEYRKSLNLVQAINTVKTRHKEIEKIEQNASGLDVPGAVVIEADSSGLDMETVEKEFAMWNESGCGKIDMETACENFRINTESIANAAATAAESLKAISDAYGGYSGSDSADGELYETDFRVWGSLEDLKALKAFLEERKMKYEQL